MGWDLHSIEVHIHAIGFSKSTKHLHQRRGKRKRSLKKMRNEDSDKCESVQSSMESSKNTSLQNSARAMRRRRSRKPKLSPTIRREKAFTAAPFSSPAPKNCKIIFGLDVMTIHNKNLINYPMAKNRLDLHQIFSKNDA